MAEAEVNALFASCLPKLRRTTRRMLSNVQDSEDALQDGLLLAFRNLHQFEGRSSFSTWLHSIVRNCSLMHFRRQNSQRGAFVDLPPEKKELLIEQGCPDSRPSPEDLCIQHERSTILRTTARKLPPQYHDAIRFFHLEGLGEEETARRLRMSPSALKAQLHRSRRILISTIRGSYLPKNTRPGARSRETSRRSSPTRSRGYLHQRELICRRSKNSML
jgi:RNA polymerase sigma-70 factor (ECF subfamily)